MEHFAINVAFDPVLVGLSTLVVVGITGLLKRLKLRGKTIMALLEAHVCTEPAWVIAMVASIGICIGATHLIPDSLRIFGNPIIDGVFSGIAMAILSNIAHENIAGKREKRLDGKDEDAAGK